MSTPASLARAAGFQALLRASGESVTINGTGLEAIVDRAPERRVPNDIVDFSEREASRIEFLRGALAAPPLVGASFVDHFGHYHRIQKLGFTDLTIWCECDVSGDLSAPGS